MKKTAVAITLIVAILAVITIVFVFAAKPNLFPFDNSDQKTLSIASFTPSTIGSKVTGGKVVLVNPTNKSFENLTLTIKIDDSELIAPILRLWKNLPDDDYKNFSSYNVPITQISIEPNQNETIQLYLFDPSQINASQPYLTSVNVQTFSSHIISFYITQNTLGDVVNGQSLTIPQEKAYLQIIGYSSIEHDNDTWHEYYDRASNRYEYVNDQPNFYQQYHHSEFFPIDSSLYNLSKTRNALGEHYFNITVLNNNTVPVEKIAVDLGTGRVVYALPDKILQPNETYVFPVAVDGTNAWNVDNVNQLSYFSSLQSYATGDLIDSQK
jgi:hypothetical protein